MNIINIYHKKEIQKYYFKKIFQDYNKLYNQ